MREQLRVGLAGCGGIARQVHLPLLQARGDVRLVAVADEHPATLEAVLRNVPNVQTYDSLSDMLTAVDLDAIVIALPTGLHASAAFQSFDAGLHAYIEKPLATTLLEAKAVAEAWRRSGRVGVIGFNCRANPLFVRMRDLIRNGRAGSLVYLRTVFATAARELPVWKRSRETGGGALLDLGAHHIDLIRFLTGLEITSVRATISSRNSEQDTAMLELQLDNGVGVHAFFSLAAAETDHVDVHGDSARLSVSRFTSLDVEIIENPGRGPGALGRLMRSAGSFRHMPRAIAARRAPLREPGYAILLDRFVRAARSNSAPVDAPDIADGLACAAVIAAAERSLVTGRMEVPSSIPQPDEPQLQKVP